MMLSARKVFPIKLWIITLITTPVEALPAGPFYANLGQVLKWLKLLLENVSAEGVKIFIKLRGYTDKF